MATSLSGQRVEQLHEEPAWAPAVFCAPPPDVTRDLLGRWARAYYCSHGHRTVDAVNTNEYICFCLFEEVVPGGLAVSRLLHLDAVRAVLGCRERCGC